jgi:hypothetical protein
LYYSPNEENIEYEANLWGKIAEKFKNYPEKLSFDLLIEPSKQLNKHPEILNKFIKVDFPIPGSPPKSTIEPGTMPPPKTLFSSLSGVAYLFSSVKLISEIFFEDLKTLVEKHPSFQMAWNDAGFFTKFLLQSLYQKVHRPYGTA